MEREVTTMKNIIFGACVASLVFSIGLNIAQYTGTLTSPKVVKLQQTDEQKLAEIYGGL
jgi:hypothetical protein